MNELTSIPSRRTDHDVHVAQEQTLVEMLAELRHLRAELRDLTSELAGRPENDERSSFEFDSNSSAGKVKVKGKAYGRTVAEAHAAAHYEFVKGMAELEAAQDIGWANTLAALNAQRASVADGGWST